MVIYLGIVLILARVFGLKHRTVQNSNLEMNGGHAYREHTGPIVAGIRYSFSRMVDLRVGFLFLLVQTITRHTTLDINSTSDGVRGGRNTQGCGRYRVLVRSFMYTPSIGMHLDGIQSFQIHIRTIVSCFRGRVGWFARLEVEQIEVGG